MTASLFVGRVGVEQKRAGLINPPFRKGGGGWLEEVDEAGPAGDGGSSVDSLRTRHSAGVGDDGGLYDR